MIIIFIIVKIIMTLTIIKILMMRMTVVKITIIVVKRKKSDVTQDSNILLSIVRFELN